jgi:hypothetical protein
MNVACMVVGTTEETNGDPVCMEKRIPEIKENFLVNAVRRSTASNVSRIFPASYNY